MGIALVFFFFVPRHSMFSGRTNRVTENLIDASANSAQCRERAWAQSAYFNNVLPVHTDSEARIGQHRQIPVRPQLRA